MSSRAIDPLGSARIDDVRDPYRAERLRAQARAERAARPQEPSFARIQAARQPAAATKASLQRPAGVRKQDPGESIDQLRGQYTAHCLRNAVLAFHDQQVRLEARAIAVNQAERDAQTERQTRADAANDLGTIQGLLPQQPYRYAAGVPLVLPQPLIAVVAPTQIAVDPVTRAAASRSTTDDALGTDPATRARSRGPRKAGA